MTTHDKATYRTIVADPPWQYDEGWPTHMSAGSQMIPKRDDFVMDNRRTPIGYPTLSVAEIAALPVDELAMPAAHLYLWTTNRYLRDAFTIIEAWRFSYSQTLVWCKKPRGLGPGGIFAQTTEYILFCRRGVLPRIQRLPSTWFAWPRQGKGGHSRKPESFLDIVESVSEGPYLELFARRNRLGWNTWGNEALEHVEIANAR